MIFHSAWDYGTYHIKCYPIDIQRFSLLRGRGNKVENTSDKLYKVLSQDERLVADDTLLKNKVIELALKSDESLIRLLLANPRMKELFFLNIEDALVFSREEFIKYVSNKEFLPDSYTSFQNRIGLSIDQEYIYEKRDAVLVWPYKDCVLEGDSTEEETKRNEIFWNTTLAPDEVDRLLDPKVLTNFKKFTASGESEVEEITDSDNLIIKGNNLLALHSIKNKYAQKVKLIYIDPPFNIGNGDFPYNDTFNHSTWLTFLKNRLEVAKELLRKDGAIFIHIDDNEQGYLKVLSDEIFGRDNFLAQIAYERSGVSGLGQGGDFLVNTHEVILCYARDRGYLDVINNRGEGEFRAEDKRRYNKILMSSGKRKKIGEFTAPSTNEKVTIYKHSNEKINTISLANYENRIDEIDKQYIDNFDSVFRTTSVQAENQFQTRILSYCGEGLYSADYLVSRGRFAGQEITSYYLNSGVTAWLRDSAELRDSEIVKTNRLSDVWSHASIPKADLANEGGIQLRRGKKPENLLKRLIELVTEREDIVLDFFLGSGTTTAVAHKLGRQYIGIEQLDYGQNDNIVRMKNVIDGDPTGISNSVGWEGGGDYIYCELMKSNEEYVERITKAKKLNEIKKIWKDLLTKAFISHHIDLSSIDESAQEFAELDLSNQKLFLLEVLDKNQLYVNLSEMDDAEYQIPDTVKKLNKNFYGI